MSLLEEKLNVSLLPRVPQRLFRLSSWLDGNFLQETKEDSSEYDQKEAKVDIAQFMSYGPNYSLEDRVDYVPNFQGADNLTDQELQDTLSSTALGINQSIVESKSYSKETGSTLVSTVCSKPQATRDGGAEVKLTTTSVGDSGGFVVVVDRDGKVVPQDNRVHVDAKSGEITYGQPVQCDVIRLNLKLHNPGPDAPDPQFRLENSFVIQDIKYTDDDLKIDGDISARGMPSGHYRLGRYEENRPLGSFQTPAKGRMAVGTLVYNNIGAAKHKSDYKAICKPDTYVNTIKIPPGGRAFVINCCDGATEGLSEADISNRILGAVTACWNTNHGLLP